MAAEDRRIPHLARPRGWYLPTTITGEYSLAIEESDRQMLCLALAKLQQQRPGWSYAIGLVAAKLPNGKAMLADFLNSKRGPQVAESTGQSGRPSPPPPRWALRPCRPFGRTRTLWPPLWAGRLFAAVRPPANAVRPPANGNDELSNTQSFYRSPGPFGRRDLPEAGPVRVPVRGPFGKGARAEYFQNRPCSISPACLYAKVRY